jgi:hypothetical protein
MMNEVNLVNTDCKQLIHANNNVKKDFIHFFSLFSFKIPIMFTMIHLIISYDSHSFLYSFSFFSF